MLFHILLNNIYHVKTWENLHSSIICPLTRELEDCTDILVFPKPPCVFLLPGF